MSILKPTRLQALSFLMELTAGTDGLSHEELEKKQKDLREEQRKLIDERETFLSGILETEHSHKAECIRKMLSSFGWTTLKVDFRYHNIRSTVCISGLQELEQVELTIEERTKAKEIDTRIQQTYDEMQSIYDLQHDKRKLKTARNNGVKKIAEQLPEELAVHIDAVREGLHKLAKDAAKKGVK